MYPSFSTGNIVLNVRVSSDQLVFSAACRAVVRLHLSVTTRLAPGGGGKEDREAEDESTESMKEQWLRPPAPPQTPTPVLPPLVLFNHSSLEQQACWLTD